MLIDMALSPVFKNIANSQLDSFIARAKYIYD
jgi:ribosome-associated toxin RatA of RatAB toxin-antitoxin module